ncbi:MAG: hypothetical protein WC071_02330, partial [Victivallaceae bacterium]
KGKRKIKAAQGRRTPKTLRIKKKYRRSDTLQKKTLHGERSFRAFFAVNVLEVQKAGLGLNQALLKCASTKAKIQEKQLLRLLSINLPPIFCTGVFLTFFALVY